MNQISDTLRLHSFLLGRSTWGRAAGVVVRQLLAKHLAARPPHSVVRISMQGVSQLDVAFASEAIAVLIQERLPATSFCLVDLNNPDLFENVAAAAERTGVPITIWNQKGPQVAGPRLGPASQQALAFALAQREVSAGEFARASGLSITNASTKLKQLYERGYLRRQVSTAKSGGAEYVYMRIG